MKAGRISSGASNASYRADRCKALVQAIQRGELEMEALARCGYPGGKIPKGVLPGILSVGYWDARHGQSWGLAEHRNEGIEFTYLAKGSLDMYVGGVSYPLSSGNLTITRPWQPHAVGNPTVKASRLYWLILDVGVSRSHQPWKWPSWLVLSRYDLANLTQLLRENEDPVWSGTAEVERCFASLRGWVDKPWGENFTESRLALAINDLLLAIYELLYSKNPPRWKELTSGERSVSLFLKSLDERSSDPWTLETMAKDAGMGRTRFSHYCQKLVNMTPMVYLQHLRLERAKEELKGTDRPITEIAFDCGFESSAYFASVFRNVMRCSPTEYRAQYASEPGA